MTDDYSRVLCAHGYVLMQASWPGCAAEEERPHGADPVQVRPAWASRVMTRCRRGKVPSARVHAHGGAR